jgi:hypothetical protein
MTVADSSSHFATKPPLGGTPSATNRKPEGEHGDGELPADAANSRSYRGRALRKSAPPRNMAASEGMREELEPSAGPRKAAPRFARRGSTSQRENENR